MESRRQEFEAFVLRCGYSFGRLERHGFNYICPEITGMWCTWNAALDSLAVQS